MYNSYLAEKKENEEIKHAIKEIKNHKRQQRYRTEIMPNLVERFNRRMGGFAKKVRFASYSDGRLTCGRPWRDSLGLRNSNSQVGEYQNEHILSEV